MRILAIDQSTRSGFAFGIEKSDERWQFGSFRLPKRDDDGERFKIFRDELTDLIEKFRPDLVAYETPFLPMQNMGGDKEQAGTPFKMNPATVAYLLGIRGVLLETCARYSIPTESFTSAAWRVTALGFGRAKGIGTAEFKRMMKQRARQLGYDVKDDNEADAIGILMHVMYGEPASKRMQGDLLESAKAML